MFYLLRAAWNVSLEEPDERVDVSGPLPQNRDEQEVEQLHVRLGHVTLRMILEQQRQDLEHVRHELLDVLEGKKSEKVLFGSHNNGFL